MNLGVLKQDVAKKEAGASWLPRQSGLILGLVLLGASGLVGWRLWQNRTAQIEAAQAELNSRVPVVTTVTALARLEPAGELVNVTAPTSTQESRIDELLVAVGDRVTADQVIAVLDNRDRLQATLQKAARQVDIAQANLTQVEAGAKSGEIQAQLAEISRLEAEQLGNVETQRAAIARIEAEVNNARADFARYDSLYQQGGISESDRDARRLTLTTTEQRLAEARATLSRIQSTSQQQISQAQSTLDRIEEVRPVDVASAQAEVGSAIAAVTEAQANLAQAYVKAPNAGQVIEIHTRPGETVGNEGVVTIGQTQQMMAVAEVYQDDIAKVQPGQPVSLTSTAILESLEGTVESIGLDVGQQQVVSDDPSINIDAKVIDVYIRLSSASTERVSGLTNLQVTAIIETD